MLLPLTREGRTIGFPRGVGFAGHFDEQELVSGKAYWLPGSKHHYWPLVQDTRQVTLENGEVVQKPIHRPCLVVNLESKFHTFSPGHIELCADPGHMFPVHAELYMQKGQVEWAQQVMDSSLHALLPIVRGAPESVKYDLYKHTQKWKREFNLDAEGQAHMDRKIVDRAKAGITNVLPSSDNEIVVSRGTGRHVIEESDDKSTEVEDDDRKPAAIDSSEEDGKEEEEDSKPAAMDVEGEENDGGLEPEKESEEAEAQVAEAKAPAGNGDGLEPEKETEEAESQVVEAKAPAAKPRGKRKRRTVGDAEAALPTDPPKRERKPTAKSKEYKQVEAAKKQKKTKTAPKTAPMTSTKRKTSGKKK